MHFNSKYINLGDSEDEIKDKINYNFNQVLSFAIGQEGLRGPKGATGIPGPSGKKGTTGPTGNRATEWTRGNTFPNPSNTQEFDIWIDDSTGLGDVYERGSTAGSWNYTGFSLYSSNYFDVYTSIIGPVGVNDKSAIGFKSLFPGNSTSLVISDAILNSSNINSNNSKLLISTDDQVDNPILSFVKSDGVTTDSPSFRWKNTGSSSYLIFDTPGEIFISSLLDFSLSSFESGAGGPFSVIGKSSFLGNTSGEINFINNNGENMEFESKLGTGFFNLSTLNFGINSTKIYSNVLTEMSNSNPFPSGRYILISRPVAGSPYNYTGGININSNSSSSRIFDFTGIDGYSVLYSLPSGSVSSGNYKQVVFGSTGDFIAGSTGAPYSYHIKRFNTLSFVGPITISAIEYSNRNQTFPLSSFIPTLNLSSFSSWNSNLIVCNTLLEALNQDIYIRVPSTTVPRDPLFYSGEGNSYRVYLNQKQYSATYKIKGIAYSYFRSIGQGNIQQRTIYKNFIYPCLYVDLFWAHQGSNTNPNPRLFYKTCSGEGGFLEISDIYPISGNNEPFSSVPAGR